MSVRLNGNDNFDLTSGFSNDAPFSYMGWIRQRAAITLSLSAQYLQLRTSGGTGLHECRLVGGATNNDLVFNGNGYFVTSATNSIVTDEWIYVYCLVATGGGVNCGYMRPGDQALTNSTGTYTTGSTVGYHRMGENQFNVSDVDGNYYNWIFYNEERSQAEVLNQARRTVPYVTSNIYAWYPFNDSASAATDFGGNAHTVTVNGSVSTEDNPPVGWTCSPGNYIYVPSAAAAAASADPKWMRRRTANNAILVR